MLKVEDLHIFYGSIEALKGISLEVSEGEIVAVLGANGAGKSTLLRAISGLLPIRNGNIQLRGEKLNKVQAYEIVIKGISHAPEGRKVFITLTVEENLNLGAYTHRKDAKVITDAKERVFNLFPILKARRNQLAGTLSGGEQQMLSIGRALMSTPRILLLDEPSLGLAPLLVRQIFQIIREINDQGVSILLVEQNARKALSIAHRGYVLETGNISISGLASDLKSNQKVQEAYLGGAAFKKKNRV
ncbi:MAG: ABC transporter ATP-binding protein [Candidatus Atribacteria bacterium]|nr:ABC transporter ATP-binding protein [Candidatus Atribacteria bacterium]